MLGAKSSLHELTLCFARPNISLTFLCLSAVTDTPRVQCACRSRPRLRPLRDAGVDVGERFGAARVLARYFVHIETGRSEEGVDAPVEIAAPCEAAPPRVQA